MKVVVWLVREERLFVFGSDSSYTPMLNHCLVSGPSVTRHA